MILCTILEGLYLAVHRIVFAIRKSRAKRFPDHLIVSIGNLSAGGTGKTPLTIALAAEFRRRGLSVLVCLRGYGGRNRSGVLVADPSGVHLDFVDAGDEAVLIGHSLLRNPANAPFRVAAGPNRSDLIERFGSGFTVVLLDDAFQNPSVHRNFDIVLIDASIPPEKLRLLPCGRFREGMGALARAGLVILTRSDQSGARPDLWNQLIREKIPSLAVWRGGLRPSGPVAPGPHSGTRDLPGGKVPIGAFCGIGNPESFFRLLEASGFEIARRRAFSDHHAFSDQDLKELSDWDLPLVTTEKDAVRLPADAFDRSLFHRGLWFVRVDLTLATSAAGDSAGEDRSDGLSALVEKILAEADGKINQSFGSNQQRTETELN